MDVRRIDRIRGPLDAVLRAMPSKSVTHRALVAAALADGESTLRHPLDADDTRATRDGLAAMGVAIRIAGDDWVVRGCGGRIPGGGTLALGESGTTMRLLTAVAALGAFSSRLDGSPRLRERPLRELTGALERMGASIHPDPETGGLPVTAGGSPVQGGALRLPGSRSSQFASALLLIAPRLADGLDLTIDPPAVSVPYVGLTAAVLAAFGVPVVRVSELRWRVAYGAFAGRDYPIEGDHSTASYFLAAAAVLGGRVRVLDLSAGSAQPDARLGTVLRDLGCRVDAGTDWVEVEGNGRIPSFDIDLVDAPDLAPTLAVLALFAEGRCVLRGLAHLRHKESDRLELLARNLRALGRHATALDDRLVVESPPPCLGGARIGTASDHRIAMAFAIAGLRVDGVAVEDPGCVAKSNPRFWTQLAELAATGRQN
jgi:3-phosphoshikimate 1-carboxyvinyltransferase